MSGHLIISPLQAKQRNIFTSFLPFNILDLLQYGTNKIMVSIVRSIIIKNGCSQHGFYSGNKKKKSKSGRWDLFAELIFHHLNKYFPLKFLSKIFVKISSNNGICTFPNFKVLVGIQTTKIKLEIFTFQTYLQTNS